MPYHTPEGFLRLLVAVLAVLSLLGEILLAALGLRSPEVISYVLVAAVAYLTGHAVGDRSNGQPDHRP